MNKEFPAFPVPPNELGMTLRDYFAAAAIQTASSNLDASEQPYTYRRLASNAYAIADVLLAERLKK